MYIDRGSSGENIGHEWDGLRHLLLSRYETILLRRGVHLLFLHTENSLSKHGNIRYYPASEAAKQGQIGTRRRKDPLIAFTQQLRTLNCDHSPKRDQNRQQHFPRNDALARLYLLAGSDWGHALSRQN